MNVAIILAGGVGSRMGAGKPKQFVEIGGRPVIAHTLDRFQRHPEIDGIEIVCVESHLGCVERIVEQGHFSKVRWITRGGATFQESVIRGVENLRGELEERDIVLIHYAVSPFVTDGILSDAIRVAGEKGNCVSATPCYLLMGSNDGGQQSTQWVDREKLMQLNSPQSFRYGYVVQLYQEAAERGVLGQVEPHTTSLMYRLGRTIYFSEGSQANIKLTTKEDLDLFEGYVLLQEKREREKSEKEGVEV